MQRDRRARFEQFAVDGGQDSNDVVAPCRAPNDSSVVVDRFEELANDQWHRLNALHFLLRPK